MIAYLIGKLADVETDTIVIETGHIGYNVKVPSRLKFIPIQVCVRMPFLFLVF